MASFSDVASDLLSGVYFDILSDIVYSDCLSGFLSGIYFGILSGILPTI